MKAQELIDAANERLEQAQYGVAIQLRGRKLGLRATLPPKPHSKRSRPHQQIISLGLPSNPLGIQQAEREAIRLGIALITGDFSWRQYIRGTREPLSELIKRFERYHRSRNKVSDATWAKHYLYYYKHLPQNKPISLDDIFKLIFEKEPHTRARQQICRQMQKLCDFALLDANLLEYQGKYNSSTSVVRAVPTDEEIIEGYGKMKSPQWRWVYGMMATYGLRDHECWLCEFVSADSLQVLGGKTGPRLIELPLYPEWVSTWNLHSMCRPALDTEDLHYVTAQCSQAFRRANIGFTPYVLRYAYGHRGNITFNCQPWLMASQMGHSLAVHQNTYQRFVNAALVRQKAAEIKGQKNRPLPPKG